MLGIGPQTVEKVKIRCRRRTCAEDGADFAGGCKHPPLLFYPTT